METCLVGSDIYTRECKESSITFAQGPNLSTLELDVCKQYNEFLKDEEFL